MTTLSRVGVETPKVAEPPPAAMIDPGRYACLGELLMDACVQFKANTALIEADRKRESARYSYADVRRGAEALTRRLARMGVSEGDRVAVVMSNRSAWLITACAAFWRGAVLVPLDYKLTAAEQEALIRHCRPALVVTEHNLYRRFKALETLALVVDIPDGEELDGAERWEDARDDGEPIEPVKRRRDDPATIVYSSGTGGRPKGCVLTHGAYLSQYGVLGDLFPMTAGDRYFSILPTNHAIDFMCGFIGPFAGGATVVHQRTLRPEFIRDTMKRYGVTHMAIVPLILEAFERTIRDQLEGASPFKRWLFDSLSGVNAAVTAKRPIPELSRSLLRPVHDAFGGKLRFLFCGGAFVDPGRAKFFYDLGIPVVIGYGLTEACTVATVNDLKPFRADTVGGAVPGVEIEIRDADPATGIGEVWLRGPTLMKEYLDDPEQTAETLVDGWLRTGDLGWIDASHHLRLVGRRKNMIVTPGGKNIYPEDIEAAFDGVDCDELAVFAENFIFGGGKLGEERLVAVVRAGRGDAWIDEIRARNRRLPDFKRIAGVVRRDEPFPRTASMKVKRHALAEELRVGVDRSAVIPL